MYDNYRACGSMSTFPSANWDARQEAIYNINYQVLEAVLAAGFCGA